MVERILALNYTSCELSFVEEPGTSICSCYIYRPWVEVKPINLEAQTITFKYATYILPFKIGARYPNLLELNARDNSLGIIKSDTFEGLKILKNLYLQDNQIAMIESGAFDDLIAIQIVNLSHNHIETIEKETFSELLQLTQLYLDNNHIATVDPMAFENNCMLDQLELMGNSADEFKILRNLQLCSKVLLLREIEKMSDTIQNLQNKISSQASIMARLAEDSESVERLQDQINKTDIMFGLSMLHKEKFVDNNLKPFFGFLALSTVCFTFIVGCYVKSFLRTCVLIEGNKKSMINK